MRKGLGATDATRRGRDPAPPPNSLLDGAAGAVDHDLAEHTLTGFDERNKKRKEKIQKERNQCMNA